MKKLFLTIGLVSAGSLAFGQGTVFFSNSSLTRISTASTSDLQTPSSPAAQAPSSLGLEYGLFFGLGESTSLALLTSQFAVNSSTGNGLIADPADHVSQLKLVAITGSNGGETDAWLQVKAWSASFGTDWVAAQTSFNSGAATTYYGVSKIANITLGLGATAGPGANIWGAGSSTTGTVIPAFDVLLPNVPEPSSFALAGLGAAAMMIFRRRK